ncbi:MAG: biliverdin-producing heme oxygenase [candidate division KSB1 bacterium]|nr:biliverdin-producing heme oxygenase [candidate division KSB1 bacterium]MDZ7302258.1 biliverdin-producing heme oxygenase [candidate division KSB1 bacterium]MDZ7311364.1 biliverdin-producing heme oxygenase [candidate division KSB1 bacterium]
MVLPLSVRLREGTKEAHRLAEHTPFISNFFEGRLSKEVYREFLVQLFHIYTALEEHQERHHGHKVLGKIYFPALYRRQALLQDLNFYYGDNHWEEVPARKATQIYVQRLDALSDEWVEGLVAHHYTRYLGDLSGGQVLKRIVANTFNLSSRQGMAFYEFPQIPDYSQFKDEYRAQLDSMPVDETTCQKIVDEANHAFALNREVFETMMEVTA